MKIVPTFNTSASSCIGLFSSAISDGDDDGENYFVGAKRLCLLTETFIIIRDEVKPCVHWLCDAFSPLDPLINPQVYHP